MAGIPLKCSSTSVIIPTRFAGHFVGAWTASLGGDTGTADIVVAPDASLAGTIHDDKAGSNQAIRGTISSAGSFSAIATVNYAPKYSLSGSMSLLSSAHLTGTLTETKGTTSRSLAFDLARQ